MQPRRKWLGEWDDWGISSMPQLLGRVTAGKVNSLNLWIETLGFGAHIFSMRESSMSRMAQEDLNGYPVLVTVQAGTALQIRRGQVSRTLARSWRSLGQYHSRFDRWRQIYNCEHLLPEKLPPVEYPSIGIVR